ncbi:MAG: nucleotide exchange factor GrpE [Kangiellaceae bacterium]|jgi:molecular chaperone GrpE|nr:nucleotide exchange factor GrpE [Kangiellaceae bacterium]
MSEQTNPENPEINEAAAEDAVEQAAENNEELTIEQVQQQLEETQAKLAEQADQVLRVRAEADNIRRRAERDVESAHKFALEGFVESLLPVIDSLEQGLAQQVETEEGKALKEGMELTLKMFADTLAKKNVEQLNPIGDMFNPERHEAMSMQDNPEFEPNAVIAVFQKGYLLNGRVVRPARVVVNKAKAPKIDEQA